MVKEKKSVTCDGGLGNTGQTPVTGQFRRWVFTINNPTDADIAQCEQISCRYIFYGRETGAEGTPHLQGFVCFAAPKRLGGVKKSLSRAHLAVMLGSIAQNVTYCSKEGTALYERGDRPSDDADGGEKARWDNALKACKEGRLDDVPSDIYLRYYRTLKEIKKDHMVAPPDLDDVCGVWLYGDPGVGKSHKARADYPGYYSKMQNKWWDGYQGHEHVILDDFDSKELGHLLKIWADRYAFEAETKGGAILIRPKTFVVTSNYKPDDMGWDGPMLEAVRRRFKVIHVMKFL